MESGTVPTELRAERTPGTESTTLVASSSRFIVDSPRAEDDKALSSLTDSSSLGRRINGVKSRGRSDQRASLVGEYDLKDGCFLGTFDTTRSRSDELSNLVASFEGLELAPGCLPTPIVSLVEAGKAGTYRDEPWAAKGSSIVACPADIGVNDRGDGGVREDSSW